MNSATITVKSTPELLRIAMDGFANVKDKELLHQALLRPEARPKFVCHASWVIGPLNNCGMKLVQGLSTTGWSILYSDPDKEIQRLYKSVLGDEWHWSYEPGKIAVRQRASTALWACADVFDEKNGAYAALAKSVDSGPKMAGIIITDNLTRSDNSISQNSFKSSDFVRWLIKNEFGVVVLLPPAINPNHADMSLATMIQAVYWIPPSFTKFTVKQGARTINRDLLQPVDDWREMWAGKVPAPFLNTATKIVTRKKNNAAKRIAD